MKFRPLYIEKNQRSGKEYAFVFAGTDLLISGGSVPRLSDVSILLSENGIDVMTDGIYVGAIEDTGCVVFDLPENFDVDSHKNGSTTAGAHRFVLLRHYVGELDIFVNAAAGYASHLLHWHRNSLFCGRCGGANDWHRDECAKVCTACGNTQYPKISPAIIILIRRGDEILLAHNRRFPEGRYSLLAGFMEMGETIEQTAAREVREEVGIGIKNISYIASQSWPFPDSLMIGLTAEYSDGVLTPDGIEITDAGWFTPENFPQIPGNGTIARKIIDEYTKTYKS